MVGGLILVPAVSALSAKTRPLHVEEMFAAYEENRTVSITSDLGE